ncbi:hypothetical protein [Amycolatopsis jiangsuensis]|uniref:Uncharacterized protein n=1 Tax=Amycolatopsis jiangsuensis TaxID=1181879 RepID=A0A840J0K2_9PSEU|nr:hypothetical protein [Amycolatopsis jiangsuensis]MBB4686972.1 hypothetical protein [Amycolatopsis jiangsuensis]
MAATGDVFARAGASISEGDRATVRRSLTEEIRPLYIAYWWAMGFGKLFTLATLFFVASIVAIFGDYSRVVLIATLSASAILIGVPAIKLHRFVWQALNLAVGVYVVALEGELNVDE